MPNSGQRIESERALRILLYSSLVFFIFSWRIGVLINDSYLIANTLVALRNGHLQIEKLVYLRIFPVQPGMGFADDAIYGRNYGLAFLALPVLLCIQGIGQFVHPQIVIIGLWSTFLALAIDECRQIAGLSSKSTYLGAILAVGLFMVNLWLLEPVARNWYPQMALQVTSICFATATVGLLYKLGELVASKRIGFFIGGVAAFASPVAFWAPLSKRHVPIGFLAVACLYGFYKSSQADSVGDSLRYRGIIYGSVGVAAWIFAVDGLLLLLAVAPIDLLSARMNAIRSAATSSIALIVAFLPFFSTNYLISGNPFRPPWMLPTPTYTEVRSVLNPSQGVDSSGGTDIVGARSEAAGGLIDLVASSVSSQAATFVSRILDGLSKLAQPERWYTVFIRSSQGPFSSGQFTVPSQNLAVVESMPVLGALLGVLVLWARCRPPFNWRLYKTVRESPTRVADTFVIVYIAWLVVGYLPVLPLHVTYTVRYLYPVYPLGLYALARLSFVQRTVEGAWRELLTSYTIISVTGGLLLGVSLRWVLVNPRGLDRYMYLFDRVFQIHAAIGTACGIVVAAWSIHAAYFEKSERVGAVLFGCASGATTVFLVFAAARYFAFTSQYAVPVSRALARWLGTI